MINKAILIGRLGQAPEVKTVGGSTVANFSVATSEKYKDRDGNQQEKTEWHRVAVWGKSAEFCQRYMDKGTMVYIEGKIQYRKYEKDGVTMYSTDIIVSGWNAQVKVVDGWKSDGEAAPAAQDTPAVNHDDDLNDEVPF